MRYPKGKIASTPALTRSYGISLKIDPYTLTWRVKLSWKYPQKWNNSIHIIQRNLSVSFYALATMDVTCEHFDTRVGCETRLDKIINLIGNHNQESKQLQKHGTFGSIHWVLVCFGSYHTWWNSITFHRLSTSSINLHFLLICRN